MAYFRLLGDWFGRHPLLYTFLLFLIACFVSIYSSDVKRFLHEWPRTKVKARQANRLVVTQRLELLNHVHGNSYNLIFYFALQFIEMVFEFLLLAIVATILAKVAAIKSLSGVMFGLFCGAFVGRCYTVRGVLKQLSNYDHSVSELQRQLAE
jgi:MFS family permease